MRPETLWLAGAVGVGGYVLLFLLANRPISLRLGRTGCLLASLAALRLLAARMGVPVVCPLEWIGIVLVGLSILALALARRVWLVRASAEDLQGQMETAFRGLFLAVREPLPGRFHLASSDKPILRLRRLAPRVQLLIRYGTAGPGKVALFYRWLEKQYPGPVPRLRIVLKGDDS